MSKPRSKFAFLAALAILIGLLAALRWVLSWAPDAVALHNVIGFVLALWCVPVGLLLPLPRDAGRFVGPQAAAEQVKSLVVGVALWILFSAFFVLNRTALWGTIETRPQDFARTQGLVMASRAIFEQGYKTGPYWRCHVVYSYTVAGKRYVSSTLNFDWSEAGSQERALDLVRQFPRGQTVPIFYLPRSPEFAVLQPGVKGSTGDLFCLLLAITLVCAIMCVQSTRVLWLRRSIPPGRFISRYRY